MSKALKIDMDMKLIEAVQARPVLYDKKSTMYKNPIVKQKAWNEVADKSSMPVAAAQQRWKALRERFLKEKKLKEIREKNGDMSDLWYWPQFSALEFLNDHVQTRRSYGSLDADWVEIVPPDSPLVAIVYPSCESLSSPSTPVVEPPLLITVPHSFTATTPLQQGDGKTPTTPLQQGGKTTTTPLQQGGCKITTTPLQQGGKTTTTPLQQGGKKKRRTSTTEESQQLSTEPAEVALHFAETIRAMTVTALRGKSNSEVKERMNTIFMFLNNLN